MLSWENAFGEGEMDVLAFLVLGMMKNNPAVLLLER